MEDAPFLKDFTSESKYINKHLSMPNEWWEGPLREEEHAGSGCLQGPGWASGRWRGKGAWAMRSVTGLVQQAEPGRQLKSVSLGESPKQYGFIK